MKETVRRTRKSNIISSFSVIAAMLLAYCLPASTIANAGALSEQRTSPRADNHHYNGFLRIYVVEPYSRYTDYLGNHFAFGFLGLAAEQPITLTYTDTLSSSSNWNAGDFAPVAQNNLMLIAVLFNGEGHPAFSYPEVSSGPFTAYWIDAAARATDGVPGVDETGGSFTHRVYLEEATDPG